MGRQRRKTPETKNPKPLPTRNSPRQVSKNRKETVTPAITPAITDNIVEAVGDKTTPVAKKSDTMTAAINNDIVETIAVVTTPIAKSSAKQQDSPMSTGSNDSDERSVNSAFMDEILKEEHHKEHVPIIDIMIDCSTPKIEKLLAKYNGSIKSQNQTERQKMSTYRPIGEQISLHIVVTNTCLLS